MPHWVGSKVFPEGHVHFRCRLLGDCLGHEKELKSLAFSIVES